MTNKERAKDFYKTIQTDPLAIIRWCKREIKAYEELIKLIESKVKK